ncbi:MAG: nucleotidyltransferase substrate binding protein [Candidatus Omnitrophota bacterium]
MKEQRIKELYADFENALKRLDDALKVDVELTDVVIDGSIQRFEFTFELAWKLAKLVLEYNGIDVAVPRLVIKEAYAAKMLSDGDGWIDMLQDRNKTSHIYDEKEALLIYEKIKNKHFPLFQEFRRYICTVLPK